MHAAPPTISGADLYAQVQVLRAQGHVTVTASPDPLEVRTDQVLVSADDAWCLGEAWDALLARSASNVLYLTRAFQVLWWQTLGMGRPCVIVGGDAEPHFIAPLYICDAVDLGRTVRLIGGTEVADYLDVIAAPGDVLRNAVSAAADRLEGEVVGDLCAPAVRPEDDVGGRRCLGGQQEGSSQRCKK
jgi:hypothetical protein